MPLYIEHYRSDTNGLSAEFHGAYLLLIMQYWHTGEPLPDDDGRLALIAACTPERWASLRPTIAGFFRIERGAWHHKRVGLELARNDRLIAQKRNAANSRHSKAKKRNSVNGIHADASSPHMRMHLPRMSTKEESKKELGHGGDMAAAAPCARSDSVPEGRVVPLRGRP